MKNFKIALSSISMLPLGILSACNYALFVFPNSFAPSGIDGVCTMLQYIFGFSMGYLSLIVNIPLLIVAWFVLRKSFAVKTGIYVIAFSVSTILLKRVDLSHFAYYTETGTSTVLAPVAAGVIRGILYAVTLKCAGSSGGVDIIAEFVRKRKPHYNLMNVIFSLNVCVAFTAYFVYGFKIEPVVCSIIYMFLTTAVTKAIQLNEKETVKFEIITDKAETLCQEITALHQSATIVNAHGAFSGEEKKMVICVTKKEYAPKIEKFLKSYPDAVVFESVVTKGE